VSNKDYLVLRIDVHDLLYLHSQIDASVSRLDALSKKKNISVSKVESQHSSLPHSGCKYSRHVYVRV
jgi:hypothetical protein